jgi:hypothetical protein
MNESTQNIRGSWDSVILDIVINLITAVFKKSKLFTTA